MTKVKFFWLFCIVSINCSAQHYQSLKYSEGDWQVVLDSASRYNKGIILYYYRPTGEIESIIENEVFTDPAVIEYISGKYIMYFERRLIFREQLLLGKYRASYSPTFIFFNSKGEPLHQCYDGIKTADELIGACKQATNPDKAYYLLQQKYTEQPSDLNVLYNYAVSRSEAGVYDPSVEDYDTIADAYFRSQIIDSLFSPKNWSCIQQMVKLVSDPMFDFISENRFLYESKYGKHEVDSVFFVMIKHSYMVSPMRYQKSGDKSLYVKSDKLFARYNSPDDISTREFVEKIFKDIESMK